MATQGGSNVSRKTNVQVYNLIEERNPNARDSSSISLRTVFIFIFYYLQREK